jgi:CelD/BcsL family acetyltransferase involved in cellulose biosynthesis
VSAPVEYEVITSAERLEALQGAWAGLWERDPRATPFQTPEWLLAWWRCLGRGTLCTVAAWSGGRLVGLAPLRVAPPEFGGGLAFLGTFVSDYLDVLCEPELRDEVPAGLLEHALRTHGGPAELQELRGDSPVLTCPLPSGHAREVAQSDVCPILPLPERVEQLPGALPHRMATHLRRYTRKLEKRGGARFEVADANSWPELLEALFQLHTERWNKRGAPGAFSMDAARGFYRQATPALLAKGMLRLHGLRVDGRIICSVYVFICCGQALYYIVGFDLAFSTLSPGSLTIGRSIEDAIQLGARNYDFLRGDEPYKYVWGASVNVPVHRCVLSRTQEA